MYMHNIGFPGDKKAAAGNKSTYQKAEIRQQIPDGRLSPVFLNVDLDYLNPVK
jgi:hypothetical protein